MNSVTWSINFLKDPKTMTVETIKLPYTTVKGVVELGLGLLRNPEKTVVTFAKSLIQAPGRIVNSFLRSIGLKKKKKKRAPILSISPQEQKRLIDKYLADLTTLYGNAKVNWFIDPFKTIEEYHNDLLLDWQRQTDLGSLNFFDFPAFLNAKFNEGDLQSIKRWSRRAHPNETIAPIEVGIAYLQIANSMENVQVASQALNAAYQIDLDANQKLNEERAILAQNVSQIKSLVDNNEERMKRALLARMNAK